MRATGWTRGLLIAGCATALLLSQEAVAETQQAGTPLSSPTASTTQADPATKITPEQEAALVEVRKILKEASEVAEGIQLPSSVLTKQATIRELERYKNRLLRETELIRFWAGDFSTAATGREYWDLAIAQIRYGHLQEAVQTATNATFSFPAETLVVLKLLGDARDLAGAMQVAEAQALKRYGGPARKQYEAELMAYMARRQAEAGKPEARETLARAIEVIRSNKNAPYQTAPYFQHVGWAAIGCAQAAIGDPAGGEASMRYAIQAAASLPREEYEGQKGWTVALIGRAAAESGLKNVSQEAFQEALRLARSIAEPEARAKVMTKVAVSQLQSGDRVGGQLTLDEALQFAESLPAHLERRKARRVIVEQQIEAGERKSAEATVARMRRQTESLTDVKEREMDIKGFQSWDAKLMTPQAALDRAYALEGNDEEQAAALAWAAYLLPRSTESVSTPEILQRMSRTAAALLAKPLPTDRQKADRYIRNLAVVQAVASGAPQALETAHRRTDTDQKDLYLNLHSLLTQKKDVAGAKQVAALLEEEWLPWDGTGRAFAELGKTIGASEDISGGLTWARLQKNPYVKVEALLGVTVGIMEREGVYNLSRHLPASIAIDKGARDTLTLGCSIL